MYILPADKIYIYMYTYVYIYILPAEKIRTWQRLMLTSSPSKDRYPLTTDNHASEVCQISAYFEFKCDFRIRCTRKGTQRIHVRQDITERACNGLAGLAWNMIICQDSRQEKTRQDTTRQDKTRQPRHDTTRHDTTRHDTTRQDKTRQDKTRQDKTRQDKTRQDKTTQHNTRRAVVLSGNLVQTLTPNPNPNP